MDRIYDAYMGKMGKSFQEKTKERIHWICDHAIGKYVLDIGCSQGIGPILLGRKGFSVLGIDLNDQAIDFGKNLLSGESEAVQKNVTFQCKDFIEYESDHIIFDTVIFGEILEHLLDPELFIEKAYRLLNQSGTLIITVPFGINDDPDHKQTFYFSKLYQMIFKYFTVDTVKVFGKWIGFIGRKREEQYNSNIYCSCDIFEPIEAAFYDIERGLLNLQKANHTEKSNLEAQIRCIKEKLDETNQKYAVATENYDKVKQWYEKEREKYFEQLRSEYVSNEEEIRLLNELKNEIKHLETQNNYLKNENAEYQRKIRMIKDTSVGKLLMWGYRFLNKIKAKF